MNTGNPLLLSHPVLWGPVLSCSLCLASFVVNLREMVLCNAKIAAYLWHLSVEALNNHLFPAPSTPFTVSEKEKNP